MISLGERVLVREEVASGPVQQMNAIMQYRLEDTLEFRTWMALSSGTYASLMDGWAIAVKEEIRETRY